MNSNFQSAKSNMTQLSTEFDSPWKEVLENFFDTFVKFVSPELYYSIDWSRGYEFADKELQEMLGDETTKEPRANQLVKVWIDDPRPFLLYIYIEILSQFDPTFPKRMFFYQPNGRYISLAILGDDDKDWRPYRNKCHNDLLYYDLLYFGFSVLKLLDYKNKWDELAKSENPLSLIVKIHLKALETRYSAETRYYWKKELYKALYKVNYSKRERLGLYRFLDRVLALPETLTRQFDDFIEQYEAEKLM